jgi:hypothetical protein
MTTPVYYCTKCKGAWQISGLREYGHLLKPAMTCPHQPRCGGKAKRVTRLIPKPRKVSAKVFYQATEGFGFPEERKCGPADVTKVLLGARIVGLGGEPIGDRTVINSLELDSGETVYLGTSPGGPIVYRMVKHAAQ